MPVAQDHLATLRKAIGKVLRTQGFRVRSKREWVRGDDDSGWVVITWSGDKWNTRKVAEAWLSATVWPVGTREHRSEVFGVPIEVMGLDGPVFSADRAAFGSDLVGVDTYKVAVTTDPEALAAMLDDATAYATSLVQWATSMLDARLSASHMRHDYAVASLLAQHPDDPRLDPWIDVLTAEFQRDPRPISLGRMIQQWRSERGLPRVPMPAWSRYASRRFGSGGLSSPRDELLAGIGTMVGFTYADGTSRLPEPHDLPDPATLARWREEMRRTPLPDGVLHELPEWLPYVTWLVEPTPEPEPEPELAPVSQPAPEPAPAARRWWRR